jgi:hypothetical protein
MKILVTTMGKSLEIGANLVELLGEKLPIENVGYFVADSLFFNQFIRRNKRFKDQAPMLLKEWEFTRLADNASPNWDLIEKYETTIGDPSLWNAIMADRRIFFGKYCKFKQDYPSRYTVDEMMIILENALEKTDQFLKKLQPDVIISFGLATLGDYLIYLFAKKKGIKYCLLKATKIKNFVMAYDDPFEIKNIEDEMRASKPIPSDRKKEIENYISDIHDRGLKYEGAILSSRERLLKRILIAPKKLMVSMKYTYYMLCDPISRKDNHITASTINTIYTNLVNPIRAVYLQSRLKMNVKYLEESGVEQIGPCIFYPLHFEPEVSLQVFGRTYQNQIEVVRNLALAAPVNMKIVVKEHPRSLGFRPFSYYKKLLEIPNVYILDPFVSSHRIIPFVTIVAVVTGTIGFEAAIMKKPVITFGHAPYSLLPDSMVIKSENQNELGHTIRSMLQNYRYDEEALHKYISAFISNAIPIDLYSVLLRKESRYVDDNIGLNRNDKERIGYHNLTEYLTKKLRYC